MLKSRSITKWSRQDDATKALLESYSEILKALETFESDTTKKAAARCEARGLINTLKKNEIAFLTVFWSYLVQHFSRSSKALQGNDADIALAISQYDSLTDLTSEIRKESDTFFEKFEAATANKQTICYLV